MTKVSELIKIISTTKSQLSSQPMMTVENVKKLLNDDHPNVQQLSIYNAGYFNAIADVLVFLELAQDK